MTQPKFDVLGIGNAIVDIISRAEDDFFLFSPALKVMSSTR